jgi:hypothetical protein
MTGNSCFFCGEYARNQKEIYFEELPMSVHTVPVCKECDKKYKNNRFCRYDINTKLLIWK